MLVRGRTMFMSMLAVSFGALGMLLGMFMFAVLMVMSGLPMMMRGGRMMRRGVVMMLGSRMFAAGGHNRFLFGFFKE